MERTFNNIHYKTINYKLNIENGYFEKLIQLVGFKKLPNDLKIEESHQPFLKQQGANIIIRNRIKNYKSSFFSGLIPIDNSELNFQGDTYEYINGRKKPSLMVFILNESKTDLTIYYFNHFYKENKNERMLFVSEFIKSL